jgi:hypothetical protein
MIIKKSILEQINNVESRRRISEKMGIGDQMLHRHILKNKPNGALTKMLALKAISEETGVAVNELLEEGQEQLQLQK